MGPSFAYAAFLNRRADGVSEFSIYLSESDLRRTVTSISTANSAMNMMITMMIVLVFISEGSSTAAGLVRRCGSSSIGPAIQDRRNWRCRHCRHAVPPFAQIIWR